MSGSVIFRIQPETWLHNLDLTLEIRLLQKATFEVVSRLEVLCSRIMIASIPYWR